MKMIQAKYSTEIFNLQKITNWAYNNQDDLSQVPYRNRQLSEKTNLDIQKSR